MKFIRNAAAATAVTCFAGALASAATLSDPEPGAPAPTARTLAAHEATALAPSAAPALKAPEAPTSETTAPAVYSTLSDAVDAQPHAEVPDDELTCLAVGVYYEAKGEPLAGQLAVAEVILNRTTSGRFPRSVCSVIRQPGQFSFVRGGRLPTPPANAYWRKALAVAQVARKDLWDSPVETALYFHARYVSPNWKRTRVGAVGNHIFYR